MVCGEIVLNDTDLAAVGDTILHRLPDARADGAACIAELDVIDQLEKKADHHHEADPEFIGNA